MDAGFLKSAAQEFAKHALAKAFVHRCGLAPACDNRSLGLVCSNCSTFVCVPHLRFTATLPPTPVCIKCDYLDYKDMKRDGDE